GVAHEINNPINGIINYAQLLVNWLPSACKERDIAERIIREGDRVAGIVRGLLFFAREGMGARLPCNVADVLTDTLTLTEAQIRKDGITLKVGVPADLGRVRASHQQLQQVFLNIISNARYALNEKFRGFHSAKILEIRGERVLIDDRPYIRIGFNDTGTGIPEAIKDKVMTPFFSTKPTCKGTGLGLSISQNIIRDHDGNLSIESREGEFTLVSIDLPAEETP
ncbi:MAG TPA: hybrid sensor histidine kinase/response regulator, partial [Geobacter sulfurreducens]|nr:hybrid sensor histidine kinase/response regulator [Geobacter sulfurreducens]